MFFLSYGSWAQKDKHLFISGRQSFTQRNGERQEWLAWPRRVCQGGQSEDD